MNFPTAEDYIRAVQNPQRAFRRPDLQQARFPVQRWGIPTPAAGNAAVVFKARVADADAALRFFIRSDTSSHSRYTALGRHFSTHGLTDSVATSDWVDNAIIINQTAWPMLQMEWIDGRPLDSYVAHLAQTGDVAALYSLAGVWRSLVARMQGVEFAHGDLQHGNVMVDSRSALRLVDFDGSWISAFQGTPQPAETGHPNYQRTGRTWDRWMDTFPGLVIYTSLLALSREPGLWKELNDGENLIFQSADYQPPFQTPVWRRLGEIPDSDLAYAVARLRDCCAPGWRASRSLEAVLSSTIQVTPPPDPTPRPASERPVWSPTNALGSDDWWVQSVGGPLPPPPPSSSFSYTTGPPPAPPTGPTVLPPPPPKNPLRSRQPPVFTGTSAGSQTWYPPTTGPTGSTGPTGTGPGVWGAPGRPGAGVTPRPRAVPAKTPPNVGGSIAVGGLIGLLVAVVFFAAGVPGGAAFLVWLVASVIASMVVHQARS